MDLKNETDEKVMFRTKYDEAMKQLKFSEVWEFFFIIFKRF